MIPQNYQDNCHFSRAWYVLKISTDIKYTFVIPSHFFDKLTGQWEIKLFGIIHTLASVDM